MVYKQIDRHAKDLRGTKAIIIGGGIAGKLFAAAISPYFHRIHILEKDVEPLEKRVRPGVSQAHHTHALLQAGEKAMEALFPGFRKDMEASGSIKIDTINDLAWFHHGRWKSRFKSEFTTLLQTRTLLETYLEKRVRQLDNVNYIYGAKVISYILDPKSHRLSGVEVKDEKESKILPAELVIDASGASSFTKTWIEKQGISVPEDKVDIGLCYATRIFELPEENRDYKIKLLYPDPPTQEIGGTLSKVEDNKYIVTLIGYLNSIKAEDIKSADGFLEYASKLPLDDIYKELIKGKSLTDTKIFNIPYMVWRRFDKVVLPEGLLVAGDSFCRVDPVFGQGMSVAALEAMAIKDYFSRQPKSGSLKKLQKKMAKIIAPVWSMVVCEDFRYDKVQGKKPFGLKFQQWYVKKIFLVSTKKRSIYKDFIKVMNLENPPAILFKPSTVKEVLRRK